MDNISSWLHIIGACIFIGGLAAWDVIVSPAIAAVGDGESRGKAEAKARSRLRLLVALAIAVLLITGLWQALRYVSTQEGVMQTREGMFLMMKITVAILAFLLFFFAPRPHEGAQGRRTAARLFYLASAFSAVGVILLSRYIR